MPEQIVFDNWPQGWIPSSSAQADFGASGQGLLRMDNLTLDEKGSLRLANRPSAQGSVANAIHSIFAAYMAGKKYRYLYDSVGNLLRNYGAGASLTVYDKLLGTGGTTLKAGFLTALGHTLALAGALQIKDRGDIQWPITIPQPAAPSVTNQAAATVSLSNLDGSGNYTNWTNISTTGYNNTGTEIAATGPGAFRTIFASPVDTTNFGVTGEDTPDDLFAFNFEVDDFTQLNTISIEFMLQDPTAGVVTDEYYTTLGVGYNTTNSNGVGTLTLPSFASGVKVGLTLPRSSFLRNGTNSSLGWNTVKAVWITIGMFTPTAFTFDTLQIGSGAVTGQQTYVAVEFNDTGQFIEYSIASPQVTLTASVNFVLVDRSGTPCNSQCNGIVIFRNNTTLGQFLAVNIQTGSYGFTPASFTDKLSDADAITQAAQDNSRILQYYRTQLPTNIIGAIYFASRVIYLTTNSFLPSFPLDLGSYDSRFTYELNATNAEQCLFITKLSVGTFIVATTVDFYQVSGTFNTISTVNADGTTTDILDVNILPLGISDPAISSNFREVEGTIFYMSATGLRSMVNGVSSLLNTSLDLLFRNESRYGFPYISLTQNDTSLMGITSSGTRIYVAVPTSDGANRILVSTYNPPLPSELRGATYWRALTTAALCLCREQDGTVLYGDAAGNVGSLEVSLSSGDTYTVYFLTQYNFGQKPSESKSFGNLFLYVDTGGTDLTLTVNGLQETGVIVSETFTLNANGAKILALDISSLIDCVALQIQITGTTGTFNLNYIIATSVQEYPPITFYAIYPFSNFNKDTLKKISKWGVVVDTFSSPVTIRVSADDVVVSSDIDTSKGISTEFWYNTEDLAATDWQIEVLAPNGMHFYKFMPPDILQVFPPGRLIDMYGPLDLDLQGMVFGVRIRVMPTTATLHYKLYDGDILVYESDIAVVADLDTTYIEKFPKGINTSVFRMVLSAAGVFYRFSTEGEIRPTGRDTGDPGTKWVKISAN